MSANLKPKRPEFLESLMQPVPRHEPEVEEASLKETRIALSTPMLDVVLRNGTIRSFGYAYLMDVEFTPGDTLTLRFTNGAEIVAEGRGLARHRKEVRLHRADEIRECSRAELESQEEGIAQIEKISITEGENR